MKMLQPAGWPRPKGYSNGVSASGRMIFVAGQIGWDETETFQAKDFAGQFGQALRNIVAVLAEDGAGPEHIVRLTWFVTDKQAYLQDARRVGELYREILGRNWPAMSVVEVSALMEDEALVEIEATAVVPHGD